jgi:DNA-binding response OmpR family regulator
MLTLPPVPGNAEGGSTMERGKHSSRRLCVLVVEDDPLVSDVVVAALEDDYETSLVDTSAAAVEGLRHGGIDLVLLDCTLPDGIDPELIPETDRFGIPLVLMSGDPQRMEGVATTARACVLKPFSLAGLLSVVQRAIDGEVPVDA